MQLKRKVIRSGLLRGGILLIIMGIGTYFTYKSGDLKQFRMMVAITIISASVSGFSALYDYDVWSVKKKITLHTIAMLCTVYPALLYSGWFDTSKISGYFIALASFAGVGIVLASIGYLVSKYILKNVPEEK
ncbi:DUF3021 family protein [Treponema sp. OMZ 792]|uniref:DUF3021 family protein n=1 Tax=unclassified Treponema TaxID=2638727 RepID=UPI0020A38954|nr:MULTISPECIES: DUF3021 family protein [unclassified Treponema]UTC75094.1 DUF3021 family protein [Treponema sp. OMZ 792]UTC81490.1 DUF3021 domain-containing protein [Treponema sp. OMZ 798]